MATGRRIARKRRIVGRVWNDAQRDVQDVLDELVESNDDGIPPGFEDSDPTTIEPDDAADPGTQSAGWAAADHTHAIVTAAASGLANANAEGSSTSFSRADHTHKRDVRVKAGATDNTRNAVRFVAGSGISVAAADDSGDDETEVTITATGSSAALDAQILAWMGL